MCSLQAGDPGKPVVCSLGFSQSPKAWDSGGPRSGRTGAPRSESRSGWKPQLRQREHHLVLSEPSSGLDDGHSHWQVPSLLSLPIQMLMFSGNTLADTPRNNVYQFSRAFLRLVKLAHQINHPQVFHNKIWRTTPRVKIKTSCDRPGEEIKTCGFICRAWQSRSSGEKCRRIVFPIFYARKTKPGCMEGLGRRSRGGLIKLVIAIDTKFEQFPTSRLEFYSYQNCTQIGQNFPSV